MNKRVMVWLGTFMIASVIIVKTPAVYTLFAIAVLGVIPGTNIVVPSAVILTLYPVVFIGIILWLLGSPALFSAPLRSRQPEKPQRRSARTKRAPAAVKNNKSTRTKRASAAVV